MAPWLGTPSALQVEVDRRVMIRMDGNTVLSKGLGMQVFMTSSPGFPISPIYTGQSLDLWSTLAFIPEA